MNQITTPTENYTIQQLGDYWVAAPKDALVYVHRREPFESDEDALKRMIELVNAEGKRNND